MARSDEMTAETHNDVIVQKMLVKERVVFRLDWIG